MKTLPDRRTFLSELVASLNLAQAKCGVITRLLLSVDRGASVQDCKETIDIAIEAFENQTAGITCQPKPRTCSSLLALLHRALLRLKRAHQFC